MKKIITILFLLMLSTPTFAHYDESTIEMYDVSEYEGKYEQLKKEYYYKVDHNMPCGTYDDEVIGKLHIWQIKEQMQGRQLEGTDPILRKHMNDPLPKRKR